MDLTWFEYHSKFEYDQISLSECEYASFTESNSLNRIQFNSINCNRSLKLLFPKLQRRWNWTMLHFLILAPAFMALISKVSNYSSFYVFHSHHISPPCEPLPASIFGMSSTHMLRNLGQICWQWHHYDSCLDSPCLGVVIVSTLSLSS